MVEKDKDLDTLKAMALGSTLAGMAFSNASTGLAHALAERIAVFLALAHGMLVAILLPYVMKFNIPKASARYAGVSRALRHFVRTQPPTTCGRCVLARSM